MKRLLIFLSFITLAFVNFNCERDDICAATTATTPRLIIEFYDIEELEELTDVPRITVYGEGVLEEDEDGNPIEPTVASDILIAEHDDNDAYVFNVNSNKIALPLKVNETLDEETITTRYVLEKDTNLRLDTDNPETSNKDIIEIKYRTEFIYVSRACGYKSIFTDLRVTRITDDDQWIANIEIEESIETTVENENTAHVRIYH